MCLKATRLVMKLCHLFYAKVANDLLIAKGFIYFLTLCNNLLEICCKCNSTCFGHVLTEYGGCNVLHAAYAIRYNKNTIVLKLKHAFYWRITAVIRKHLS